MIKHDQQKFDPKFDQKFDQKFDRPDHFDVCASESDIKDSKELDVESDNNDVNSASTRSEDFDEYKHFDKSDKVNFNYNRQDGSAADRANENVSGYYFNSVYPEYLVPRTFCKESEDVPCDLSNWHRSLKFEQSAPSVEAGASGAALDGREGAEQAADHGDHADQPINFAYYHF